VESGLIIRDVREYRVLYCTLSSKSSSIIEEAIKLFHQESIQ
jgi:hypothetical protein